MELAFKPHFSKKMTKVPLWIPFFLAFFAFLFSSAIFSTFRLFYFAPFLAIVLQRLPLQKSLWIASFCGLALDLLSTATRFGLYSLLTVACALLAYRFKRWFFEESLFSIPLYTALISSIFVLLQWVVLIRAPLWLPLFDALYAFLWFTCPILLYNLLIKRKFS
ncbi:MAG: hypothetical protein K1000chlam3_00985 [Chlamydiae bacterium]|nr:hypothetical protein [Chlamydiota bacterium]